MTRSTAEERAIQDQAVELMESWPPAERLFHVLCEVVCERHKQEAVHGAGAVGREATLAEALDVLREECGEVMDAAMRLLYGPDAAVSTAGTPPPPTATLDQVRDLLYYECVQVAATAAAMAERVRAGDWSAP